MNYEDLVGLTPEEGAEKVKEDNAERFLNIFSVDRMMTAPYKDLGVNLARVNVRVKEGKIFEFIGRY